MNGKGSRPRNNYSKSFRDNYSLIEWSRKCSLCEGSGYINEPKIECPACKKSGKRARK